MECIVRLLAVNVLEWILSLLFSVHLGFTWLVVVY